MVAGGVLIHQALPVRVRDWNVGHCLSVHYDPIFDDSTSLDPSLPPHPATCDPGVDEENSTRYMSSAINGDVC